MWQGFSKACNDLHRVGHFLRTKLVENGLYIVEDVNKELGLRLVAIQVAKKLSVLVHPRLSNRSGLHLDGLAAKHPTNPDCGALGLRGSSTRNVGQRRLLWLPRKLEKLKTREFGRWGSFF